MSTQLLLPVHTYLDGNTNRLATHAIAIAKAISADIYVFPHVITYPSVSNPFGKMVVDVPKLVAEGQRVCRERATMVVEALGQQARTDGIRVQVTELPGFDAEFSRLVAEHARYHDLTLVGMKTNDRSIQVTAEAVLFGSGKPVLLASEEADPLPLEHALIAWDGSRSAARAVSDAREILEQARRVSIVTVTDEKPLPGEDLGQRLSDHLERAGIRAEATRVQTRRRPIDDTIRRHAEEVGASLIVMGAFGHSRMRDFVLGGATRGMISAPQVLTFLAH